MTNIRFASLLVCLLVLSVSNSVFSESSSPSPSSSSSPTSTSDASKLLLDSNTFSLHESVNQLQQGTVLRNEVKGNKYNLMDLEKSFMTLKSNETNKNLSPTFWKDMKDVAIAGPVKVVDTLTPTDFDVILVSLEPSDASQFIDITNTVFQTPEALRVGKESKKVQSIISSCIDFLDLVTRNEKSDASVVPMFNLFETLFSADEDLVTHFKTSGGGKHLSKLAKSSNSKVKNQAQSLFLSYDILDGGSEFLLD